MKQCIHQLKIYKTSPEVFSIQCQKCAICRNVDFTPSEDELAILTGVANFTSELNNEIAMLDKKNKNIQRNESILHPDAGTVDECYCTVCDSKMDVTRSCYGVTSSLPMSSKRNYDMFECPYRKELWHKQVIALKRQAKDSCSFHLKKMLLEEASQIYQTRVATVEAGTWSVFIN